MVSSTTIFQISLSAVREIKVLCNLKELFFPFRAELVNEKIFIFQFNNYTPEAVLIYDLLANECREMPCLPVIVWGMSTVVCGDKIVCGERNF